MKENKKKIL